METSRYEHLLSGPSGTTRRSECNLLRKRRPIIQSVFALSSGTTRRSECNLLRRFDGARPSEDSLMSRGGRASEHFFGKRRCMELISELRDREACSGKFVRLTDYTRQYAHFTDFVSRVLG